MAPAGAQPSSGTSPSYLVPAPSSGGAGVAGGASQMGCQDFRRSSSEIANPRRSPMQSSAVSFYCGKRTLTT